MGRLFARVREAEERLAGLARALQSAYDEELAEAAHARDAALDGLSKAEAMELAARALGRDELATRLREVIEQLGASIAEARQRLEELDRVEESIRHRFAASNAPALPPRDPDRAMPRENGPPAREISPLAAPREVTPPPAARPPPSETPGPVAPVSVAPPAFPQPDFADEEQAEASPAQMGAPALLSPPRSPASPPPGVSPDEKRPPVTAKVGAPLPQPPPPPAAHSADELRAKATQLGVRVLEIEKAAMKMGRALLKLAVEEHIALARLLSERLRNAGLDGPAETRPLLDRLGAVAAAAKLTPVFGLQDDEFADWAKTAAQARSQRLALVEARRRDAATK